MRLALDFDLRPAGEVTADSGGRLYFPLLPAEPGLYQFRLRGVGATAIYVGESDNLRRRLAHYRSPGPTQFTNTRLNERLRAHLADGGTVDLDVVTTARITIEDAAGTFLSLARKADRRLLENAVLVLAAASGADEIANL